MKKIKTNNLIIFFVLCLFLSSCTSSTGDDSGSDIIATSTSDSFLENKYTLSDVKDKGDYLALGNESAELVIIDSQGGPAPLLSKQLFLSKYGGIASYFGVYVLLPHQQQSKYPTLFSNRISFDQAKEYSWKTVDMLYDVVNKFRKNGKKVILSGESYGTFVVQGYIQKYGTDGIDGFVLLTGRLNFEDEFWREFSHGRAAVYDQGVSIRYIALDPPKSILLMNMNMNMNKLQAGLGYVNYMETLSGKDLSKVFYGFGIFDEKVGKLRDDERSFLINHGAEVLSYNGGHASTSAKLFPSLLRMALDSSAGIK